MVSASSKEESYSRGLRVRGSIRLQTGDNCEVAGKFADEDERYCDGGTGMSGGMLLP